MPRNPGDPVRNSVRLLRPLATGGMGSFWTAWHEALGVEVGVKFIDERYVEDPEALERFRREAAMAARIKSPHIVQVFDHGVMDDGAPYIIMELLEGESLGYRIEKAPLSFEDAARVIVQVARGLTVAHERGIVHRDIKPENIYLCDDEDGFLCKVLDFGVGRHLAPGERKLTAPGVLIGTPEYMSPEMILGRRETDRYADLWSLAVVAYHALAGRLPFDGDTAREIVLRVVTKPHRPLSELRDDVTAELDAWFESALAKDVTKRFANARELASAFVAAVDARRPSLRFSHPDLALAEDPDFHVDHAPTLQRPRPALGSNRGTVRIQEKLTPNGTAVIPRETEPESAPRTSAPVSSSVSPPESLPPPAQPRRIPLGLLLAVVSVVSALLTLLVIRLFSDPDASSATSQLVPPAIPHRQPAPIQSERAPPVQPSTSASPRAAPANQKTLPAPAPSTDYGF